MQHDRYLHKPVLGKNLKSSWAKKPKNLKKQQTPCEHFLECGKGFCNLQRYLIKLSLLNNNNKVISELIDLCETQVMQSIGDVLSPDEAKVRTVFLPLVFRHRKGLFCAEQILQISCLLTTQDCIAFRLFLAIFWSFAKLLF